MRICTGSSSGETAQPPRNNEGSAAARTTKRLLMTDLAELLEVHDLDAAIERIGLFVAACDRRALLPVAHRRELRLGHTLQQQRAAHRLAAALAETDVVFARAALVGMTFQTHFLRGILGQECGMRSHHGLRI